MFFFQIDYVDGPIRNPGYIDCEMTSRTEMISDGVTMTKYHHIAGSFVDRHFPEMKIFIVMLD